MAQELEQQVKASIIRVAGDIAVEYLRQYGLYLKDKNDLPWQLDDVLNCFDKAYRDLIKIISLVE